MPLLSAVPLSVTVKQYSNKRAAAVLRDTLDTLTIRSSDPFRSSCPNNPFALDYTRLPNGSTAILLLCCSSDLYRSRLQF
jgi:hypothetical protein